MKRIHPKEFRFEIDAVNNRVIAVANINNMQYPVIYRRTGGYTTNNCPYCGKRHRHSKGIGIAAAKCKVERHEYHFSEFAVQLQNEFIWSSKRGYYIHEC